MLARFVVIWPTYQDTINAIGSDLLVDEWLDALKDLKVDQIRHGLEHARTYCKWPPSIAEFREMAVGGEDPIAKMQRGPAYQLRNGLALPGPKDQTSRKNAMRRLKEILPNINVSTENQNA